MMRREYSDDCPYIENSKMHHKDEWSDFRTHSFKYWQPFRLNINIIGHKNRKPEYKWWSNPKYQIRNYGKKVFGIYIK